MAGVEIIRTSPVRIETFNNSLFVPQKGKNAKPDADTYFNCTLMFDKSNPAHIEDINKLIAACDAVLVSGWPDESTRPRIPHLGTDDSPIKDGDTWLNNMKIPMKEKYPHYVGHYIIRVSRNSKNYPPHVIDMGRNYITDQGQIYSGCWCHVSINPYQRMVPSNPGISIGLNGVQKYADGDRIGGGGIPPVEALFDADPNFNPAAQVPGGPVPSAPVQPSAQPAANPTPAAPAQPAHVGPPAPAPVVAPNQAPVPHSAQGSVPGAVATPQPGVQTAPAQAPVPHSAQGSVPAGNGAPPAPAPATQVPGVPNGYMV